LALKSIILHCQIAGYFLLRKGMKMDTSNFKLHESEVFLGGSDSELGSIDNNGGFILTNQRVIKVVKSSFGAEKTIHTFNLENIDSIFSFLQRQWVYLIVALLFLIVGIIEDKNFPLLVLSGLIVLAYFKFTKKLVKISSGRSDMYLDVNSMKADQVQELVSAIEDAKQKRLNALQNKQSTSGTPVSASIPSSLKDKLKEIEGLKADGLISEEEYNSLRAKALSLR